MDARDRKIQAIEDLRSYGASLVDSVSTSRVEVLVGRSLARRSHRPGLRRIVPILATMGLLAVSNVALAAVADSAAPGDFLYVLDRGYEWARDRFGPSDRTQERLAESEVLDERGDTHGAIAFLQEELAGESSDKELLVAALDDLTSHVDQSNPDQGNPGQGSVPRPDPSTPAVTAPGQVKDDPSNPDPASPADTAPGQIKEDEVPGTDPPGQNKNADGKVKPQDEPPAHTKAASHPPDSPGRGHNG